MLLHELHHLARAALANATTDEVLRAAGAR